MAYKSGQCYICEEVTPVDNHHLHPLEYGGAKDGRQVKLCKTCHSMSHYEAELYAKEGRYNLFHMDFSPKATRMYLVIQEILKAKLAFTSGDIESADDQRRMSQISWDSEEELAMAHEVKRALGMKALDRAIKQCVYTMYDALKRKGRI